MCNEENTPLKQAERELAYLSGDPDFKRLVEARAGFIRDQNTEKAIAMKKGEEKSKVEIAKKLKNMNMNVEFIIEATGLSKKEVENL